MITILPTDDTKWEIFAFRAIDHPGKGRVVTILPGRMKSSLFLDEEEHLRGRVRESENQRKRRMKAQNLANLVQLVSLGK